MLPNRTLDTMTEAIALSSPNGSISKRAKNKATARLANSLFGDRSCFEVKVKQPSRKEYLTRRINELEGFISKGFKPKGCFKELKRLKAELLTL